MQCCVTLEGYAELNCCDCSDDLFVYFYFSPVKNVFLFQVTSALKGGADLVFYSCYPRKDFILKLQLHSTQRKPHRTYTHLIKLSLIAVSALFTDRRLLGENTENGQKS